MIKIEPLDSVHLDEAAALFVSDFARLRRTISTLPPTLESNAAVTGRLRKMAARSLVAIEDGQLVGYLAWWLVDRFRGSGRRGAYVPEWAHAARSEHKSRIYRALYRAAAAAWAGAGCEVHAITLLAEDDEAQEAWFWNGFGLTVVDAVRAAEPLAPSPATDLTIRRASVADAEALAELDAEHVLHYSASPVFMALPKAETAAEFRDFLKRPKNSVWLALDRSEHAGFMRFTGYDFDAVAALESETAAFCNAAFMRSGYRGRGAGPALLQAALEHYKGLGLAGLYVNFEAFNPEAASFWPRFFRPACLSLTRVPEILPVIRPSREFGHD